MSALLNIKKLIAKAGDKQILNGINLQIKKGEIHALMGPNGCGKSSLAKTLLGHPIYKVKSGSAIFTGKNLFKLKTEERVEAGLVLADQNPPTIKGINLETLLTIIADDDLERFFPLTLPKKRTKMQQLVADKQTLFARQINYQLSGGEKKISELFQILALKPKLVIFDEIDSGLDITNLEKISQIIKEELITKEVAVLFITHSGAILNTFKPDYTHVMVAGEIICTHQDYQKVLTTIRQHGYEQCKHCPFLAD